MKWIIIMIAITAGYVAARQYRKGKEKRNGEQKDNKSTMD